MFSYSAYRRWRRRRMRRRLALLLAALTVAAIATQHLAPSHPASQGPSRMPTRPAAHQAGTRPRRHPASHPGAKQTAAKPTLTWEDFHGIQLPVSAQAGPRHQHNGLARGFADTPLGAVLAAVNIVVRTAAQWGPPIYRPTITHQVTSPGATALMAADNSDYAALRATAHVPPGQPAGRGYAVEAAYRLTAYTPHAATVDIVTEGPASNNTTITAVTRIQVVWRHGDWRVLAPPGGTWVSSAATSSVLRGYTAFPNER